MIMKEDLPQRRKERRGRKRKGREWSDRVGGVIPVGAQRDNQAPVLIQPRAAPGWGDEKRFTAKALTRWSCAGAKMNNCQGGV